MNRYAHSNAAGRLGRLLPATAAPALPPVLEQANGPG